MRAFPDVSDLIGGDVGGMFVTPSNRIDFRENHRWITIRTIYINFDVTESHGLFTR